MFQFGPTAEEQAKIRAQQIEREERLEALFSRLSALELIDLKSMFLSCRNDGPHQENLALYYVGIIDAIVKRERHKCACCGEDSHMESAVNSAVEEFQNLAAASDDKLIAVPEVYSSTYLRDLEEWNLRLNPVDNKIYCIKCGIRYISLQDRQLKAKDDCHGCQIKDSQG